MKNKILTTTLLGLSTLASTQDTPNVELNLSVLLTGSQIEYGQDCEEKLKSIGEVLTAAKHSLDQQSSEAGLKVNLKNIENLPKVICENLKESHRQRLEQELAMKDIYEASGENSEGKLSYFSKKNNGEDTWEFDVTLSGSIHSGNSDFTLLEAGVGATGEYAAHTLKITTKGQYKDTEEDTFKKLTFSVNNDIQIDSLTDLSEKYGAFWDLNYLKDESKGIENSYDVLVGGGYNFLGKYSGSDKKLKVSMAIGYRSRKNSDGTQDNNPLISTRVKYEKELTDVMKLELQASHVANIEKFENDFERKLSGGLRYKINDNSSLRISYENSFDNTPVSGKEKDDSLFKVEYNHKF